MILYTRDYNKIYKVEYRLQSLDTIKREAKKLKAIRRLRRLHRLDLFIRLKFKAQSYPQITQIAADLKN